MPKRLEALGLWLLIAADDDIEHALGRLDDVNIFTSFRRCVPCLVGAHGTDQSTSPQDQFPVLVSARDASAEPLVRRVAKRSARKERP